MRLPEIKAMADTAGDPVYVVDACGVIVAWNSAMAELLGVPSDQALDRPCWQVVRGVDECGPVCSENCPVRRASCELHPIRNFDMQLDTPAGRQWVNASVLLAPDQGSVYPYAVHILRGIDVRKKLEIALRDFLVTQTHLPPREALAVVASGRTASRQADLTPRELEILGCLAAGGKTSDIAARLHISRTTLYNHVQRIYRKFDVHGRVELIRKAERAGLV